jgi:hypothetical protein
MSKRKAFALRVDEKILTAMHRWADDDLRSLNAQIEFHLRDALRRAGRLPKRDNSDRKEDNA